MNSGPFQQLPKVNQTTWCRVSRIFKVQETTFCSKLALFDCFEGELIWSLQHTLFNTLSFWQVCSCCEEEKLIFFTSGWTIVEE